MKYFKWLCLMGLVLLAAACEKEYGGRTRDITFNATIEQYGNPADEQKIILRNEQWIYWEIGDQISIASDKSASATLGDLVNASAGTDFEDFNGVFIAALPEESKYFLGLHPYDEHNVIECTSNSSNFGTPTLYLAATQPLRHDSTFSRKVLPMVGWYGGHWDEDDPTPFNLDFHNLGAIVRIQLFNATGADAIIDHITFTSVDEPTKGIVAKKLSGPFSVHDYTTENPYLREIDGRGNPTVTITCGEDGLAFAQNALKSFYLVLPAFGGRETTTNLRITMDVVTKAGTHCIKTFTAPTRRTGVTYMNAMGVSAWSETGAASAGLVGNGTASRPFKIYTINDLLYLRSCYNSNDPVRRINGQPITANTHIKIMRSDIVLTHENWNVGIRDFIGHLTSASNSVNPGIIDSCVDAPLFENILSGGVVEGLTMKSAVTFNLISGTGVSPLCYSNAGTIKNCVITTIPGAASKTNLSSFSSFAGICVNNTSTGTIEGCRFEGKAEVQEGKNFAGICLQNTGTLKGCQITSTATVSFASNNSSAAGICYDNQTGGKVYDSYFAADITSSTVNWAGIVYDNSGTVEHCYFSSTGHIYTSKGVGGIVKTNKTGGKVDYCWLAGQLRGKVVGGIVDSLAAGQVINCFTRDNAMITLQNATDVGGGLVARMTGGSIENSYVNECYLLVHDLNATFGGVVGKATGGTCSNCYDNENHHVFYGTTSGTTYNNCCLVDGSQASIGHFTASKYEELQTFLNGNKPTGGKTWEGAANDSTPPHLKAYSVTSKRR